MPHSDLHDKKKKKNFAMLAVIATFFVLFWVITMVKMGWGS